MSKYNAFDVNHFIWGALKKCQHVVKTGKRENVLWYRMYKIISSLYSHALSRSLQCTQSVCVCVFEQREYIENELLPSSFMAILEDVQVLNARYCFLHTLFLHFFLLNSIWLFIYLFFASKNINTETTCSDTIRRNRKIGVSTHTCVFETKNSAQHNIQHERIEKKTMKNKWIILVAIF